MRFRSIHMVYIAAFVLIMRGCGTQIDSAKAKSHHTQTIGKRYIP